jgi:hypothetical protein
MLRRGLGVANQINIFLTIQNRIKGIPYGAVDGPEGSTNHGYKRLKGNPFLAASIPEAQEPEALKQSLMRISAPETAFFTIGCEKSCNPEEKGFWIRGYLELAFNFVELVSDAQNYFKLFYDFNRVAAGSPGVIFEFQLEAADFADGPAQGFSLTLWITTSVMSAEDAWREWSNALLRFVDFIEPLRVASGFTPIYEPGKPFADL